MQVYTPNTILIPQEIKEHPVISSYLIHHFHSLIKSPSGRIMDYYNPMPYPAYSLDELLSLEEKKQRLFSGGYPLFHDIFLREYQGGQQLILIGLSDDKLTHFIGHPQIWHKGQQIDADKIVEQTPPEPTPTSYTSKRIINPDATTRFQAGDTLELRWTKPDFSFTHTVTLQPYLWRDDAPKLTLHTVQQDEPLEWIRDWILYHHRIHGVERALIYDNQSQSRKELVKYLPQLENESLEICLIPWDVSYNPFSLSLCQHAQIDHAYCWLWDKASWNINCDIDEYLINRTGVPLTRYLKRYADSLNPALTLPGKVMSAYRQDSTDDEECLPQATDFTYVAPTHFTQGKTIIAGARRVIIHVHEAFHVPMSSSYLLALLKHLVSRKPQARIPTHLGKRRGLRRVLNALSYYHVYCPRFSLNLPPLALLKRFCFCAVYIFSPLLKYIFPHRKQEWGLYFYHYWGLSRNQRESRGGLQATQHEDGYQDSDILKLLKKAGIGKYYRE